MRIGILGGTFDPVHLGHLIIGEEARTRLGLDEVVFVPTGQPWLRPGQPAASREKRLAMVRLAIASNPFFRASSMEIDRPGVTYTVDTLEELKRELGEDAELFFVLGMDSLEDFHRWKDPARILELCTLAAMVRPGHARVAPESLAAISPSAPGRVRFFDSPQIGISGTEIRRRVAQGLSIRYWVTDEVEAYIQRCGLYRNAAPEGRSRTEAER